jgi:carbonic anhydrase/acetyltransferase-like protein (isoleucine patch superfamily)
MAHVGDIDEERLAGDVTLTVHPDAGVQGEGGMVVGHRVILHGCERSCNV